MIKNHENFKIVSFLKNVPHVTVGPKTINIPFYEINQPVLLKNGAPPRDKPTGPSEKLCPLKTAISLIKTITMLKIMPFLKSAL